MVRPNAPTGATRPARIAGQGCQWRARSPPPAHGHSSLSDDAEATTRRGICAPRAPVVTLPTSDRGHWRGNGGGGDAPACGSGADRPASVCVAPAREWVARRIPRPNKKRTERAEHADTTRLATLRSLPRHAPHPRRYHDPRPRPMSLLRHPAAPVARVAPVARSRRTVAPPRTVAQRRTASPLPHTPARLASVHEPTTPCHRSTAVVRHRAREDDGRDARGSTRGGQEAGGAIPIVAPRPEGDDGDSRCLRVCLDLREQGSRPADVGRVL